MNGQSDPGGREKGNRQRIISLMGKIIEVGQLGDGTLLVNLTDPVTNEIEALRWDDAPDALKAMAKAWAIDPLRLIERHQQAATAHTRDAA